MSSSFPMISIMNLTQKHLNWTIKSHQRISRCRDESVQYALSTDHSSTTSMYIFNSKGKKLPVRTRQNNSLRTPDKRDGFAQHLRGPCTQWSNPVSSKVGWTPKESWQKYIDTLCPQKNEWLYGIVLGKHRKPQIQPLCIFHYQINII